MWFLQRSFLSGRLRGRSRGERAAEADAESEPGHDKGTDAGTRIVVALQHALQTPCQWPTAGGHPQLGVHTEPSPGAFLDQTQQAFHVDALVSTQESHHRVVTGLLPLFGQTPVDPPDDGMEEVDDLQQVAERTGRGVQPPEVDKLVEQHRVECLPAPGPDQRRRQQDARLHPSLNQRSVNGLVAHDQDVHRTTQAQLGAKLVDAPLDLGRQRLHRRAQAGAPSRRPRHLDGDETEHADAPGQEEHDGERDRAARAGAGTRHGADRSRARSTIVRRRLDGFERRRVAAGRSLDDA